MERIDPSQHFYHLPAHLRSEDRKAKKAGSGQGIFSRIMAGKAEDLPEDLAGLGLSGEVVDEDRLGLLVDDIHHWGAELASNPSPGNIQEYRKRVTLFLRSLLKSSIMIEENEGRLRKDMKRPKYTLIRVVNQKLDQLAAAILQNQKDKFQILAKTEELHGMLVDLLS